MLVGRDKKVQLELLPHPDYRGSHDYWTPLPKDFTINASKYYIDTVGRFASPDDEEMLETTCYTRRKRAVNREKKKDLNGKVTETNEKGLKLEVEKAEAVESTIDELETQNSINQELETKNSTIQSPEEELELSKYSGMWTPITKYVVNEASDYYIDHIERFTRYDEEEILEITFLNQKKKNKRAASEDEEEDYQEIKGKRLKLNIEETKTE